MSVPNVLATRYAGADLAEIWSPEHKIVLERELWIAVLRAQRDLGIAVPDGVVEACPTDEDGPRSGRATITVTPWQRSEDRRAVTVDLVADPAAGGPTPPRDWVDLVVTPGAVVVWAAGPG